MKKNYILENSSKLSPQSATGNLYETQIAPLFTPLQRGANLWQCDLISKKNGQSIAVTQKVMPLKVF